MASPKRKKSKSVTKMGQANKGYTFTLNKKCKKCYNLVKSHYICRCTI